MECTFDIEVNEPDESSAPFRPFLTFRLTQLNKSANCYTESEIDYQAELLNKNIADLSRKAKKKLRDAKAKHKKLFSDVRDGL